ncbi:unnamed protein product, partial [Prorocentrum cordatum]
RQSLHDMCEWLQARIEESKAAVRVELDELLMEMMHQTSAREEARAAALDQRLKEAERMSSDALQKSSEASARADELGARRASLEEPGSRLAAEEKELLEQLKARVDQLAAAQAERAEGASDIGQLVLQTSANCKRIEELGVELRQEDKETEHRVVQRLESRLEHQRLAEEAAGSRLAGALGRLDEQAVELEAVRAAAAAFGGELERLDAEVQQWGEARARADERHGAQLQAGERAVRELEDRLRAEQEQAGRERHELRERLSALGTDLAAAARERAAEHAEVQE